MLLQISCSTVIHTLDHITQQDNLVIDSLSKKKKQKKSEEDVNGGELLRGEKALCFIASLLDMLLLKKDQAHRSLEYIYIYIFLDLHVHCEFWHRRHFCYVTNFLITYSCLGSSL